MSGFVLQPVFAVLPILSPAGDKAKAVSYSRCINSLGVVQLGVGLFKRSGLFLSLFVSAFKRCAW